MQKKEGKNVIAGFRVGQKVVSMNERWWYSVVTATSDISGAVLRRTVRPRRPAAALRPRSPARDNPAGADNISGTRNTLSRCAALPRRSLARCYKTTAVRWLFFCHDWDDNVVVFREQNIQVYQSI